MCNQGSKQPNCFQRHRLPVNEDKGSGEAEHSEVLETSGKISKQLGRRKTGEALASLPKWEVTEFNSRTVLHGKEYQSQFVKS